MSASFPRQRVSIWASAQDSPRVQRQHYLASGGVHPGKMLPAIARHAITAYTRPGDLVLDPMCGTGTTLVEAVRAGRDAIGVDCEPRWTAVASANLHHARLDSTVTGQATTLLTGDARGLGGLLPAEYRGRVDLVVTSPPYGPSVHGRVKTTSGQGIAKTATSYGDNTANLAHQPGADFYTGLVEILTGCRDLLAPHGRIVITVRPYRHHGLLVDLPALVAHAAVDAGLVLAERCVALLAAWRDGHLVARPSFFALDNARRATAAGRPTGVIAHEDVLVFAHAGAPDLTTGEDEPSSPTPPRPGWPR